jgi:hypothetical protein
MLTIFFKLAPIVNRLQMDSIISATLTAVKILLAADFPCPKNIKVFSRRIIYTLATNIGNNTKNNMRNFIKEIVKQLKIEIKLITSNPEILGAVFLIFLYLMFLASILISILTKVQ